MTEMKKNPDNFNKRLDIESWQDWWIYSLKDQFLLAYRQFILTLFWKGGGQICPPAGFFNIAQKPLGLGSWNFATFSFYI